ncbi:dessication-induced 1VOC superfamily protein [Perilla frutescens var. frutescens]|nr:dessication-induced 1VOC superfamily protein [Perilla frutescens var. frutescens]
MLQLVTRGSFEAAWCTRLNPVFAYTVVYVKDVAKSVEFYGKAFGYNVRRLDGSHRWGELESGQTTLAFTPAKQHETDDLTGSVKIRDRNPVEVCFDYADVDAAYTRAVENGAEAVAEPEDKEWGQRVGYVRDIDGIVVSGRWVHEIGKPSGHLKPAAAGFKAVISQRPLGRATAGPGLIRYKYSFMVSFFIHNFSTNGNGGNYYYSLAAAPTIFVSIIMRDSQQDSKKRTAYEPWTKEETDLLLELMVDGVRHGWRDNSVGNGVAVGRNSIGLGIATDANTLGEDENRNARIEDLTFDPENDAFVALSKDDQPPSSFTPPSGQPEVTKSSTQRPKQAKRSRTQYETTSGSSEKIMEEYCIGAIDGTHIPAMITGRKVSSFRNRHGMQSQNVLAACNFDLQFMYVLSGWEGSAHNSKLLSDALSRTNGLQVPQGKYFLLDCGFANRRQFLATLRGVRYHLKDFGGQGRHPRNASELFNLRHASLRNVIERISGVFKSRFTIFKTAPPFSFQIQAELVLACAGLHNFFRKECRSDEFPVEYEGDEDLPPPPPEEENMEWLSQSQLQQRTEANAWRMSIANAM